LKTNIKFYCIYQFYQQCFSTQYLFLDTAARLQSCPRLARSSSFFLIMFNKILKRYVLYFITYL
jgi:hypothetical protein